jgi:hypothetical protein
MGTLLARYTNESFQLVGRAAMRMADSLLVGRDNQEWADKDERDAKELKVDRLKA